MFVHLPPLDQTLLDGGSRNFCNKLEEMKQRTRIQCRIEDYETWNHKAHNLSRSRCFSTSKKVLFLLLPSFACVWEVFAVSYNFTWYNIQMWINLSVMGHFHCLSFKAHIFLESRWACVRNSTNFRSDIELEKADEDVNVDGEKEYKLAYIVLR